MQWLLCSEKETGDIQRHLRDLYKEGKASGVWLIQPNGIAIHSRTGSEEFPFDRWDVRQGLLDMNALNGNIKYLKKNPNDFQSWLSKEKDLKLHFLHLKTLREDSQIEIPDKIKADLSYHICRQRCLQEVIWNKIKEEDVKAIAVKKIPELPVDLLYLLEIDWDKKESCLLTKNAVEMLKLTDKEEAHRRTEKAFNNLSSFQMALLPENFPKECLKWFSVPEKIELIPTYLVQHLSLQQLQHINKNQAKKLCENQLRNLPTDFPAEKIKWIVADEKIKLLPLCFAKFLSSEQIYFATEKQVKQLIGEQIKNLSKDLPEEKINPPKGLPKEKIKPLVQDLSFEQLPHIDGSQVKMLSEEQIKNLPENFSKEKINLISEPEKIQLIPPYHAKHFSVEQVVHATENQAKKFSIDQMATLPKNFSKDRVNFIWESEKIKLIPPYLAKHFDRDQMIHATTNQVKELTDEQVDILPEEFPSFNVNEITNLANLPAGHIHHLANEKLRFVKKPAAINSVGFMRVQHLVWTQLRERHWFWNTVYVVGVVTLGIVSTALALLAYMTLIPFVLAYRKRRPGRPNCVFSWLNANSLRVVRLVWVACTGKPY